MLQDLSDALKTWDTDKKHEKLSSAAQESDILSAIENKLLILKSYIEKIETGNQDLQEIFDLAYADFLAFHNSSFNINKFFIYHFLNIKYLASIKKNYKFVYLKFLLSKKGILKDIKFKNSINSKKNLKYIFLKDRKSVV